MEKMTMKDLIQMVKEMEARLALVEEKAALAEEKSEALQQELKAAREKTDRLRAQAATQNENTREQEKQYVVISAARVAKDETARGLFREQQVADGFCKGGFVAHKFYLDFVLAAREVRDRETLEQDQDAQEEEIRKKVISEVEYLGSLLSNRMEHSMLTEDFCDEEGPQSAMAAEMFRLAIDAFQNYGSESRNESFLRVTHRQHLVSSFQLSDEEFDVIQCTKEGDEKQTNEIIKADDRVDICVWFCHPNLGPCVVAACEYKPNSSNSTERVAQVDIYGSNILVFHKKPCIVIDIAGGTDLKEWQVSVSGLIKASFTAGKPSFEKTPLYEGKGAEAIAMVARGLVAAHKSFPNRCDDFGQRLGPVVGMKKFVSDWKTQVVKASVFGTIIKSLKTLHIQSGPHGDIRLSNLLTNGRIIDFDFVRAEHYPDTLQSLKDDGKRHPEVEDMITNGSVLAPKEYHDWFSLGQVMKLFVPTDENNKQDWESICNRVENLESNDDVDALIQCIGDYQIKLGNTTIPLVGTREHT
eukprot:scaffold2056_cov65-Cylindrotheca_fusiformis.AAC.2